ncbi:MAG TPA: helix-turn-helix domain-containing protein [Edaphobacter sp.]|nr:helix-turn-helix domain-containing protein [Edaphobacter sp.]
MDTAAKPLIAHRTTESRHLDQIESVVQGGGATSDLEEVSASWRRCTADLLINPDGRAAPHIVTDSELRIFREPVGKAIVYAQEEVDRLYAIVRQEGYVVLLCNTDGIAIHHRGDETQAEQFKERGIWVGGVWSEGVEGTNGIGTCIAEQRPVLVHRDQHFRTRHIGLSCAGAPIFDPTGRLELVLDTSSMTSSQSHTLAMAATKVAARAVEERLFREWFRNVWTIAAVPSDDSGPALLLAVDSDLRIVGADRVARTTFALDDEGLSGGVRLSMVFDHDRSIFRSNREQDIAARFTRAGTDECWHVLITPPLCSSKGWRSATDVAIHARPRMSMLRNAPMAESLPPNRGGLSPARTHRICEYIHSNLDQNISLEALAEMAGLSTHHFARAFKQTVGMPPHGYVLQRRIEHAQKMLRNTDLPMSEIALSAGFSDQSHLARHFRRITGMSPGVVRWEQR